jgi:hypothetical protein
MHVIHIFPALPSEASHLAPPPAAFLRDSAIVEARMLREAPLFAAKAEELRHIPDYMLAPPPDRMSREASIVEAAHAEFLRHLEGCRAREAETAAFAERRRASRRALREIFRAGAAIIAPGDEA